MKRIFYVQYTNPGGYPPLQHSSRILAERGWDVYFLGTGAHGADALDFPPHPRITVRRMSCCRAGPRQKLHYLVFALRALYTAVIRRPAWIYASDPLSCPAAWLIARLTRIRVIYHEHDSPPPGQPLGLMGRFRARLARRAALCILPNQRRVDTFDAENGPLRGALCVWNCPGLYECPDKPRDPEGPVLRILYHGSIVPDRVAPEMVDVLASLPENVRLRIVGYETIGSTGYIERLRARAKSLGVESRIEFLPAMPRDQLLKASTDCDIGLALVPRESNDPNFRAMAGASNKAFDYLSRGLPIVVSDLPEWRELFVDPGYAVACDPRDPAGVARALRLLIENPARMRAMGEAGRRRIRAQWNYENAFAPVLALLEQAPPGSPK